MDALGRRADHRDLPVCYSPYVLLIVCLRCGVRSIVIAVHLCRTGSYRRGVVLHGPPLLLLWYAHASGNRSTVGTGAAAACVAYASAWCCRDI